MSRLARRRAAAVIVPVRPRSRRRRLLEACVWRSTEIEGIRDYVRRVERAIERGRATMRMRGRP